MTNKYTVALIGAGAMGGSLLRGWLKTGSINAARSVVFEPIPSDELKALLMQNGVSLNPAVEGQFDAVVAAVKPQAADDVLPAYAPVAFNSTVISVMAGKSVANVSRALGGVKSVARAMPNLPAGISKGVSGLYAPESVGANGRAKIEVLMSAVGEVVWVAGEEQIDIVTAVSGSGPAYYFLLTEALAEAGEAMGLSADAAAKLARATFIGAGALLDAETRSPEEMRRAVTSPGGTTEAALNIFEGEDRALRKLVCAAAKAAAKRSGELTS